MSHVLKNKVTNVVFETVNDGGSITLEAELNVFNCYEPKYLWDKENEAWIEHTFKAHDANEFEVVTGITLPDDFVNGKYMLTKNNSNEWIFTKLDGWDEFEDSIKNYKPPKDVQPYPSWTFVEETWTWECPVALPDDHENKDYRWDEDNQRWYEST